MDPALEGIKRPMSAYMFYNNHRRPILTREYPELSLIEVSKLIGEEWGKLSEGQKQVFQKKAQENKLEYEIKVAQAKGKAAPTAIAV